MFAPNKVLTTGSELWRWRAEATPERIFLRYEGKTWTFGTIDLEARRVAAALATLGVTRATRVAVGLTNRPEALSLQLALQQLGAISVPLLPGLRFGELEYPLRHSKATVLVVDGPVGAAILPRLQAFPDVSTVVATEDLVVPAGVDAMRFAALVTSAPLDPSPLRGHDASTLAMILYTSGSTGRPKGVMICAGSFATVGDAFAAKFGLVSDDNYFLPTPMAHAVGALTAVGIAVHTGSAITLVDRFRPSSFWQQVIDNRVTTSILFPAHLNFLLEADHGMPGPDEHPLRLVITHTFSRRFRQRFGVQLATVWGMTETGAICTGSEPGYEGEFGESYVGTAMRGAEVGVFDERFHRLRPSEAGEICLRHRNTMLGYLDDPEGTAKTLVDGWIRSGDRGVIDDHGRVFFGGRFKNMIKRSGENISAEEVELVLDEHPEVSECAVFGVPDRLRSEEVGAVVVVRRGAKVSPSELRRVGAERLSRWKLPRYVLIRDDPLPRLANGKIDRVALTTCFEPTLAWDAEAPSK
jgi:crotonobetaine/carnitine-CoA ligase